MLLLSKGHLFNMIIIAMYRKPVCCVRAREFMAAKHRPQPVRVLAWSGAREAIAKREEQPVTIIFFLMMPHAVLAKLQQTQIATDCDHDAVRCM